MDTDVSNTHALYIPRTWHGTHLNGLPGYMLAINDNFFVSIALHPNEIVSCIIFQNDSQLRYWSSNISEMLQWIANSTGFSVYVDYHHAVYPTDDTDDSADGEYDDEGVNLYAEPEIDDDSTVDDFADIHDYSDMDSESAFDEYDDIDDDGIAEDYVSVYEEDIDAENYQSGYLDYYYRLYHENDEIDDDMLF